MKIPLMKYISTNLDRFGLREHTSKVKKFMQYHENEMDLFHIQHLTMGKDIITVLTMRSKPNEILTYPRGEPNLCQNGRCKKYQTWHPNERCDEV